MLFEGCQGKAREITITEKTCPQCGSPVELFSVDSEMPCPNCGFVVYPDAMSCVQWCQQARQCVGEQAYDHLMRMLERRKAESQQPGR